MSTTTANPVSIKQHLLGKKFEDSNKSKLEIVLVSTNTAGVHDFARVLQFSFSAPRFDGQPGLTNIRKDIELSVVHTFEDAMRSVIGLVEQNRPTPTMKRPYREYCTDLTAGLRFGYVKPTEAPGDYFVEALQDGDEVRVVIGDEEQVGELRYFFSEVQRYQ